MLLHNFIQDFVNLVKRVDTIERVSQTDKITIPSSGYFVIKVVASDPASPQANEVWINSTTSQLKWNDGGTVKAVALA